MEHTLRIKIQSFSDVITNSSSELFCTIFSDNHLNDIYKFLKNIITDRYDGESISMCLRGKETEDYLDKYKDYPDTWIEVDVPYDYSNILEVLQVGLEAMLENKFKDEYKIVFE